MASSPAAAQTSEAAFFGGQLVDRDPAVSAAIKQAERLLDDAGLTCNKNGIPFDPEKPFVTSGIRLGSAALTTRGFDSAAFEGVAELISLILDTAAVGDVSEALIAKVQARVIALCDRYPIYQTVQG